MVSGMVKAHLMPRAAQIMARPMPVLPEVGSRTMVSGPILPAFWAASIMATAIRSLTLLPGLKNSSLAATVAVVPAVRRLRRTRGVLPTSSVTLLAIFILGLPLQEDPDCRRHRPGGGW